MKRVKLSSSLVAMFILMGCSDKPTETELIVKVGVIEISNSTITDKRNYVGTVEEIFSSSLSFEVSGNVNHVFVSEGQRVKKSQLLASLETTALKNNHKAALSTLHQAKDAFNRYKRLYDSNSLPEIKWIDIQTSLQQAEAMERIAFKNLKSGNLYAPFMGYIAEKNIEAGTVVAPGLSAFRLIRIDRVKIKIAVPEKEIGHIYQGLASTIKVPALHNQTFRGVIVEKGVTANPLSHTYEAKIELANPSMQLMPGMVCSVNLLDERNRESTIVLPNQAIQLGETGIPFVWLVKDGKATRKIIQTGTLTRTGVIITGGIEPGDLIITEGSHKVSEGIKIEIQ